jgi:hypothetical protein
VPSPQVFRLRRACGNGSGQWASYPFLCVLAASTAAVAEPPSKRRANVRMRRFSTRCAGAGVLDLYEFRSPAQTAYRCLCPRVTGATGCAARLNTRAVPPGGASARANVVTDGTQGHVQPASLGHHRVRTGWDNAGCVYRGFKSVCRGSNSSTAVPNPSAAVPCSSAAAQSSSAAVPCSSAAAQSSSAAVPCSSAAAQSSSAAVLCSSAPAQCRLAAGQCAGPLPQCPSGPGQPPSAALWNAPVSRRVSLLH